MRQEISNHNKDKRIFTKSANATKKMNTRPPIFRGGIRL